MYSAVDDSFGRLMRALEEQHLTEDTIVVFTSDYGDMLGSHGLEGANLPFEESVRVPLVIRYPRQMDAGRRHEFPLSNVDLMPTLLSLCGVPSPDGTQGQDLSALLSSGQGPHPESVYCLGKLGAAAEWRMLVRALDKLGVDLDRTQRFQIVNHAELLQNRGKKAIDRFPDQNDAGGDQRIPEHHARCQEYASVAQTGQHRHAQICYKVREPVAADQVFGNDVPAMVQIHPNELKNATGVQNDDCPRQPRQKFPTQHHSHANGP